MGALERQTLEEAFLPDRLSNDVDVEVVTVGGEGIGEDRRREALRDEARRMARRRLQRVCDEGLQTVKPGL